MHTFWLYLRFTMTRQHLESVDCSSRELICRHNLSKVDLIICILFRDDKEIHFYLVDVIV
jgi:hypothetical protein